MPSRGGRSAIVAGPLPVARAVLTWPRLRDMKMTFRGGKGTSDSRAAPDAGEPVGNYAPYGLFIQLKSRKVVVSPKSFALRFLRPKMSHYCTR